jgi:hypothetical protein
MSVLSKDAESAIRWSTTERIRALKRIVSRRAISKALRSSADKHRYCKRLPRWYMVWFVIALGLFCRDSYRQIFRWMKRFNIDDGTPGRSTICVARQSIGVGPLWHLSREVIQLQARPDTPHAFYASMRLMAIDGFVLDLPDTPENARAFGRPGGGRSPGAFPQVRTVSLCEVGTHVLWRSVIKPQWRGEPPMAHQLMRFLEENMLLLWDRGFLSYLLLRAVRTRQAHLLARVKKDFLFTPIRRLPDGSFLAKIYPSARDRERDRNGIVVRIIEYTFDDPGRPGKGEKHRLLTTLLSARDHPAKRLIMLYHSRWEEEITIDELKTHQRERPVLRSQTPAGVVQEIYGLLLGHFVIRKLMVEAALLADCAPRDLSFVNTLKILRCRLPEAPRSTPLLSRWFSTLLREVSQERLEPRRDRVNPRVIKRKLSYWPKKREKHRNYPQPTKKFRNAIVILE